MQIVILGCGRVGARLAAMLDPEHKVSVIDQSIEAFERLPATFRGRVVLGQGIDFDILKQARIETADVFCALTNQDNVNIMAAQVAKEVFHIGRAITRIYDPARQDTYVALGLEAYCPTRLGVDGIEDLLDL